MGHRLFDDFPANLSGMVIGGGRFRVDDRFNRGGMGDIYRGVDLLDGQRVAIKILRRELGDSRVPVERFRREALMASRLQHPNVIRVVHFGVDGPLHYIAMEYLEGITLAGLLGRRVRLSFEEVVAFGWQICGALGATHDAGFLHRDVKPENILILGEDGGPRVLKVLDFGLAKVVAPGLGWDRLAELTRRREVLGTPEFMSPEQAQGHDVDSRSDLFAVGSLLYLMATGHVPFKGFDDVDTLFEVVDAAPRPPSSLHGDIDPRLEALILRALDKDPAKRFSDAYAMRGALESLWNTSPALTGTFAAPWEPQPERRTGQAAHVDFPEFIDMDDDLELDEL